MAGVIRTEEKHQWNGHIFSKENVVLYIFLFILFEHVQNKLNKLNYCFISRFYPHVNSFKASGMLDNCVYGEKETCWTRYLHVTGFSVFLYAQFYIIRIFYSCFRRCTVMPWRLQYFGIFYVLCSGVITDARAKKNRKASPLQLLQMC